MNTLCVILARSGSVGLPNKNEMIVAGRPMLDWTLDHALGASRPGRVVLSTDGARLAEIARMRGVEVVMRPLGLANNTATVDAAARHAVEAVGRDCDAVVILYGNVPVRPPGLIDRAAAKLIKTGADSVQSVYHVDKAHPYWMKRVEGDALHMYEPNDVYRRQDLPPVYMLDGGVIAVTRRSLFNVIEGVPHAFLGADRRAIVTERGAVVDVDDRLDLHVAEAILLERHIPNLRAAS